METTQASKDLMVFLKSRKIHPIVAYVRNLDVNHEHRVNKEAFCAGLKSLGHEGCAETLFHEIDRDSTGYILLSEIDPLCSDLWAEFQAWCFKSFHSATDMEKKMNIFFNVSSWGPCTKPITTQRKELQGQIAMGRDGRRCVIIAPSGFNKKQFERHAARFGWYGGYERILFDVIDPGNGLVTSSELEWIFAAEKERHTQRCELMARRAETSGGHCCRASMETTKKRIQAEKDLSAFKSFLLKDYGNVFKAWRILMDPHGTMRASKRKFFNACAHLGWDMDVEGLWQALDIEDTGKIQFEVLSCVEARVLLQFRKWMKSQFGFVKNLMRAFNSYIGGMSTKAGVLTRKQFVQSCAISGYELDAGGVFDLLCYDGDERITIQNVVFLDHWTSHGEWLLAEPNEEAAQTFKELLRKKFKHFVHAWKVCLDPIGIGKVSWAQFKQGAQRIRFNGDLPGCWAYMDQDGSGAITLREIDPESADLMVGFRCWAHDCFGSVATAFDFLDKDGSGSLSLREFAMGFRGFPGNVLQLYLSLGSGVEVTGVTLNDVAFLDEWTLSDLLDGEYMDGFDVESVKSDSESGFAKDSNSTAPSKKGKCALKSVGPRQYPRIGTSAVPAPRGARPLPRQRPNAGNGRRTPTSKPLHEAVLADIGCPGCCSEAHRAIPMATKAGPYAVSDPETCEQRLRPLPLMPTLSSLRMAVRIRSAFRTSTRTPAITHKNPFVMPGKT